MTTVKRRKPGVNGQLQEAMELVVNSIRTRYEHLRRAADPRRNIEDECGHIRLGEPVDVQFYFDLYGRDPIATRVVDVFPCETWKVSPWIYEEHDTDRTTPFEMDWDALGSTLLYGQSWYKSEKGSPIWGYLKRADILSGIGRYGVILLGLSDNEDLSRPVGSVKEIGSNPQEVMDDKGKPVLFKPGKSERYVFNAAPKKSGLQLNFLRVLPENMATISARETNIASPRYGMPTHYSIQLDEPDSFQESYKSVLVHWSRVIHVPSEKLTSSEYLGTPRMEPVYDRILDARKLYGGSAEMYWKGALPGLVFKTLPQLGADVSIDHEEIKEEIEAFQNQLQRFIAVAGVDVDSLAPQVVDPSPQIERQIEAICIELDIPKRIFMGSERGELSSGQDKTKWDEVIQGRQYSVATPNIIVPFVDRLIMLGLLSQPKQWYCEWPALSAQSETEKSEIALRWTEAITKYVQAGGESFMAPMDFLVHVLGKSEEDAQAILDNALEFAEEHMDDLDEEEEETQNDLPFSDDGEDV